MRHTFSVTGIDTTHSVAIGKRITPRHETQTIPGNHHYCFVDFSNAAEAERALNALNGKEVEGGQLRVSVPKSKGPAFEQGGSNHGWRSSRGNNREPREPREPRTDKPEDGQDREEERRQQHERQRVIMSSNNWRRGG